MMDHNVAVLLPVLLLGVPLLLAIVDRAMIKTDRREYPRLPARYAAGLGTEIDPSKARRTAILK